MSWISGPPKYEKYRSLAHDLICGDTTEGRTVLYKELSRYMGVQEARMRAKNISIEAKRHKPDDKDYETRLAKKILSMIRNGRSSRQAKSIQSRYNNSISHKARRSRRIFEKIGEGRERKRRERERQRLRAEGYSWY